MDLELTNEQHALQAALRSFAVRELRPNAARAEADRATPDSVVRALDALGIATTSESDDGTIQPVDYLLAAEELAYGDPGATYGAFSGGHASLLLARCGSREQRERYGAVAAAPAGGSVLYYEGWGREPYETEATAALSGPGWSINGEKFFVPNPGVADVSIVIARDIAIDGLRAFVFEGVPSGYLAFDDRDTPNTALRGAHTGAVALRGIEVAADGVLTCAGIELARALAMIRLTVPAVAIGAARAATEYAIGYANERIAFGKPISAFQGVAFLIADADTAIDAARLALWSCALDLDTQDDPYALARRTSEVVSRVCSSMERVARDCVQVLGGSGFIKDHPVEYWWRSTTTLAGIDTDPLLISAAV